MQTNEGQDGMKNLSYEDKKKLRAELEVASKSFEMVIEQILKLKQHTDNKIEELDKGLIINPNA